MTTEVIAELNQLISVLEADLPANPNTPKNQRQEKALERELRDYFKALGQAFPYEKLSDIYYKHVAIESIRIREAGPIGDAEDFLETMLAVFRATLFQRVSNQLITTYLLGSAQMTFWGKTKGGLDIAFEGPPIQQAFEFAEKYGAKLVTLMDDETKQRLAKIISDGIQNKRGIPGLARDIRTEFADMTRYRSQLIAKTETRNALFHASQDRMEAMGIEGKEWVLGSGGKEGNCDYCRANAAVGIIPVDEEFPTPQYEIHPGCLCAIAPASLPE